MIKIVELFAGIGGFRKGFADAAAETHREVSFEFVSEWDKFAQISYEAIWGEKPQGDITKVDAKDIPDHDILVGGFPCQAFSTAGKMQGFDDTRGTLFFDMARIAKEKKPKAILMENVKGLVGHDKGRTLDTMVKTLNDIGYVVDFEVLNSKYYDVPQNRERIFIVAIREDLVNVQQWVINGNTVVPKGKKRIQGYGGAKTFNFEFPKNKEVRYALRDVLEEEAPESFYLSEEKTETLIAELEKNKGVTNTGICGETASLCTGENISSNIDANYAKGMGPSDIGKNRARRSCVLEGVNVLGLLDIKGAELVRRVYDSGGQSPTLTTMQGGYQEPKIVEGLPTQEASGINRGIVVPVLTPDRVNKRQNGRRFKENDGVLLGIDAHPTSKKLEFRGFKQKEIAGALLATDYKAPQCLLLGDVDGSNESAESITQAVTMEEIVDSVKEIAQKHRPKEVIEVKVQDNGDIRPHKMDSRKSGISELNINYEDNPSFAVTTTHAPKIYGSATRNRIRKLTPLECWRLQAFGDEDFMAAKEAGVSNSQLYKQAGNSVTTTVIKALALQLYDLLDAIASGKELTPPQGQTNIFDFI